MSKSLNMQKMLKNSGNRAPVSLKKHKLYDDPSRDAEVRLVDTSSIYISKIKNDRLNPNNDTSINELAENIQNIGQLQPCILRYAPLNGQDYELIVGERRYHAVKKNNDLLKAVVIDNLSDENSAISILSENNNREDISDFELYNQISLFIEKDILKQADIVAKAGISKQKVSKVLKFKILIENFGDVFDDYSNISASTAEYISSLDTGDDIKLKLLEIKEKIQSGMLGHTKINAYINKIPKEKVIAYVDHSFTIGTSSIKIGAKVFNKIKEKEAFYSELDSLIEKFL